MEATDDQALSIKIDPATLTITTASLPAGQVGTAYSQTLAVTGGANSITWSISAGDLPGGLTLDADSGVISGTPTASGTFDFTVTAADNDSNTDTQTLSITINSAPQSGGGGGSPVSNPVTTDGLSGSSGLNVNEYGYVQRTTKMTTEDSQVTLGIHEGTRLLDSSGNPLSSLTAAPLADPPSAPEANAVVLAYTFGPSGATFNPALTLSFTYDPANLPEGVNEADLYIAYFDGTQWQKLETTVDPATHTLTAQISHFSSYAVLGEIKSPASTPAPTTTAADNDCAHNLACADCRSDDSGSGNHTAAPVSSPAQTDAPSQTSEPSSPNNTGLIMGIIIALIVVLGAIFILLRRRRSSR